jgi:hypothetical protein
MQRINGPEGVRGWLLVLSFVLVVWQPVTLAAEAAAWLNVLPLRGLPLAAVLVARIAVAALGIAAGIALLGRRPPAVMLAKGAVLVACAMDVFVETSPLVPHNRFPGTTPYLIGGSIAFYGVWLGYLMRSKRVRNTFG